MLMMSEIKNDSIDLNIIFSYRSVAVFYIVAGITGNNWIQQNYMGCEI